MLRLRCIPLDEQVSDGVEHPKLEICHFVQQPDNVLLDLVPVHGRLPPLSSWCFWIEPKGVCRQTSSLWFFAWASFSLSFYKQKVQRIIMGFPANLWPQKSSHMIGKSRTLYWNEANKWRQETTRLPNRITDVYPVHGFGAPAQVYLQEIWLCKNGANLFVM